MAVGSPRRRTVLLGQRAVDWVRDAWLANAHDDQVLFLLIVSALIFAYAYMAMWWVFRTGSSILAIGLPGTVRLVTAGTTQIPGRWYLAAFLLAAIPLATRSAGFRQEACWQQQWIAYPRSLRP